VVLVGLLGGLAMAAIVGARRTQSSYATYLARTNAMNVGVNTAIFSPPLSLAPYDPALVGKIARLALVRQVADFTVVNPNVVLLGGVHGRLLPGEAPATIGGSLDGAYSTVGRVTVTHGRIADPNRADEVFLSTGAARQAGVHVGAVIPVDFFTNAQLALPNCCSANGTGNAAPHLRVNLRVVGIGVVNPDELIEDDVDRLSDSTAILTPALMRKLIPCCAFVTETAITVRGGNRNAPIVAAEVAHISGRLKPFGGTGAVYSSTGEAKAERAIEPESIALAVFGAIVTFAVLLVGAQAIGRQLRAGTQEREVLRALGASPGMTIADGLVGVLGAVATGGLLAGVIAVALSPWVLLGPVRPVLPRHVAFDWTILAVGMAGLVVLLSVVAVVLADRAAPHRARSRRSRRPSYMGRAAANAGLPTPAVIGVRYALDSGTGTGADPVPTRSAIVAAILALVVLSATVTFAASLHTLVSRPRLYGWNWNYELLSGYSGQEDLPQHTVATLLDHDPYVKAWSGIYFSHATIGGNGIPIIGADPDGAVQPPLLSGHQLDARDQIVLGPRTLAELHKHLGDTVSVTLGPSRPVTLHIVGTFTMPAIGNSNNHTDMGTGAWLAAELIPAQLRNIQQSPIPGPHAVLIRTDPNSNPTAALHSLQQINNKIPTASGGVTGVLRPAEIVNYRTMGNSPALLGATLAFGAIAALMLTLLASVRRRRNDFALLKTLGLTRRRLAAIVAWQSSLAIGIGTLIGVPVGIIAGRNLWNLFAHAINAIPQPTVPTTTLLTIAIGALVLANLIAAIPALQAANTPTADLLHE
jgi:hypothetical protein